MKLTLVIVLFGFNLLNRTIAKQSNACIDQTFTTDTDPNLEKKFMSEFSALKYWQKKLPNIFGSKEDYLTNYEICEQLCACVLYKRNKNAASKDPNTTIKSFEEILEERVTAVKGHVSETRWYAFIPITYKFPSIECSKNNEKWGIVRGLKKKSNNEDKPIHDIYVGHFNQKNGSPNLEYEGIIKDVDVSFKVIKKPKEENS